LKTVNHRETTRLILTSKFSRFAEKKRARSEIIQGSINTDCACEKSE